VSVSLPAFLDVLARAPFAAFLRLLARCDVGVGASVGRLARGDVGVPLAALVVPFGALVRLLARGVTFGAFVRGPPRGRAPFGASSSVLAREFVVEDLAELRLSGVALRRGSGVVGAIPGRREAA
jgi:hypothetical protein